MRCGIGIVYFLVWEEEGGKKRRDLNFDGCGFGDFFNMGGGEVGGLKWFWSMIFFWKVWKVDFV